MSSELQPCPFCGGTKISARHDDGLAWKRCDGCGATGPENTKYSGDDKPDWNTRALAAASPSSPRGKEEADAAELERLRAGLAARGIDTSETEKPVTSALVALSHFIGEREGNPLAAVAACLTAPTEEGEADMRRVCEALGFDPTNHHNAAKCPYCTPEAPTPTLGSGEAVAWRCTDLILGAVQIITDAEHAAKRAANRFEGMPTWRVEPLFTSPASPEIEGLRAALDIVTDPGIITGLKTPEDARRWIEESVQARLRAALSASPVRGEG